MPRHDFQVVHICGKDKVDNLMLNIRGYKQFEYVKTELKIGIGNGEYELVEI